MMFTTSNTLILGFLVLVFWRLLKRLFFRTVLDNVPGPSPSSFLAGSLPDMRNPRAWDYHQKLVETYGGVAKVKAPLGANILSVSDPKALYHILVKDDHVYAPAQTTIEANRILFGEGIFSSMGDRHRAHRKLFNPAFSIAHMRDIVPIFYEVGHKLRESFLQKAANGTKEIDVTAWMTRCSLELIGRSGLGYSFDTLAENSLPHRYADAVKGVLPLSLKVLYSRGAMFLVFVNLKIGTPRFRKAIADLIPSETVMQLREIINIFHETSVEILETKKAALRRGDQALADQIGQGKDIISILLRENMKASEEDKLSDNELLGQVTSLTFAATDTTSGALSRIFHLLALHKDVQAKLRQEILEAREESRGEDFSYDTLVSLPYLDAVCRETLRLYPPVSSLMRETVRDIVLPLAVPIKGTDGKEIDAIPIPKGTKVAPSIIGVNRDPELWGPDAYEWKPERWSNSIPESVINARIPGVYSHLLTFSGGGKSCIGFKFSQLEIKVVLVLLLEKIEFSPSDKEIFWQMNPIATPNVDMDGTIPTLPMKISLVNPEVQSHPS